MDFARRALLVSALTAASIFASPEAHAAKAVTLAWDRNPEVDVIGYRVQIGTSSGWYTQTIDVAAATTAIVPNLNEGATYYFAVTAYNSSLLESAPSNQVTYLVPGVAPTPTPNPTPTPTPVPTPTPTPNPTPTPTPTAPP
ncbi:MAG TPA: fibronectin type III domain-containing protein, partial [Chthoniobacterales bacterium]